MDPADSYRVMDPRWLQLPLEPIPLNPDPSYAQTPPPDTHQSPVNSPVETDAFFSDTERVRVIGGGVYEALHRPSSHRYALKVIPGHRHTSWPRCQTCDEIKALVDVDEHPNVVGCRGVRDAGDGEIQVLLDYVDGGSLEGAHIRDEERLSRLALQMLSGLAHLQERKVVHRDVKPSNLLIDSRGNVKIADWINRILAQSMDTWESFGRPVPYMSPERINPDLKLGDYDECAGDIWSLGVCILEIYQGKFPYARGKQMQWLALMFKIGNSEPPQAPPTASMEFRDFIACCLQKEPSKRWTAAQLLRHPFIVQHNHLEEVSTESTEPPLSLAPTRFAELERNRFVLQHNHQERISTELTEAPLALAASSLTKLDLNLSLGGPQIAISDSLFKPSDVENEQRAQTESNITDQSERADISPSSVGCEKSDRIQHREVQLDIMHTESSEGFHDEPAYLEVPTCGDWQGWTEQIHGVEERRMKMKSVMNDQDQREDVGVLSEDENPREMCNQEKPDEMLIGSTERSDNIRDHSEVRPDSDIGMDDIETDPCYTDLDTEAATMVPAGQIHRMLTASEIHHQIQISDVFMQNSQGAALREQFLPVEMSIDANIGNDKTEPLRGCAQIDDRSSPDLFNQNNSEDVHSETISKEKKAGPKSCLQPLDMLLPLQDKLKKGPWTSDEDQKLVDYIKKYGIWNWKYMPKAAGLNRSGKSCRLRWMNYLRPNIKRGKFSEEEEQVILRLHQTLGNRWQAIAKSLPGRTDNEIKNFWNTHLKKKLSQTEKEQRMDAGNS